MAGKYVIRYTPNKGVVFVTTNPGDAPVFKLANGQTIVGVRADKRGGTFANSGESDTGGKTQYQWIVPQLDDMLGTPFTVTHAGQTSGQISITGAQEVRTENGGLGALKAAPNKATRGMPGGGASFGGANSPYTGGYYGGAPLPPFMDVANMPQQANVQLPPYPGMSPEAFQKMYGQLNRDTYAQNLQFANEQARQLLNSEMDTLGAYAPFANNLQQQINTNQNRYNQSELSNANAYNQGQIEQANIYNQQYRDQFIEKNLPGAKAEYQNQLRDNARLARGLLPTDIQDRVWENQLRESGLDNATTRGLGETSPYVKTMLDKYEIDKRLGLQQQGQQNYNSTVANALKFILDEPIKYNPLTSNPSLATTGRDIRGTPTMSGSQMSMAVQNELTPLTMSQVDNARNFQMNENRYIAEREYENAKFNAGVNYGNQYSQWAADYQNAVNGYNFAGQYMEMQQKQRATDQLLQTQALNSNPQQINNSNVGNSNIPRNDNYMNRYGGYSNPQPGTGFLRNY